MPAPTKPKKIGRPKLPKGEAKGSTLLVRLSPEDRKRIEKAAKASNLKASQWARNTLMAAVGE